MAVEGLPRCLGSSQREGGTLKENLILGKPSGESQKSFKKWLEARAKSE